MEVDIVVNVQGDEPFIEKESLAELLSVFKAKDAHQIDLASLKTAIETEEDIVNPNHVKVITNKNDYALYFSRSPIPYIRNKEATITYYKHIGIYAFRKKALMDFYHLPMLSLENAEKLEQLRYLEYGKNIKMVETNLKTIGIDTPEDLEKARKLLAN